MTNLALNPLPTQSEGPTNAVLLLKATDEGWALIDAHGSVVFSAEGQQGRPACLAFARDQGVLALIR